MASRWIEVIEKIICGNKEENGSRDGCRFCIYQFQCVIVGEAADGGKLMLTKIVNVKEEGMIGKKS